MTGFGAGRGQAGAEVAAVELRSVNGKFCEVKPHLPRELVALEVELVRTVKARLHRGSIDAYVRREGTAASALRPKVDLALASAYAKALREMKEELGLAGEPTVQDVASLEQVVTLVDEPPDLAAAGDALRVALEAALAALERMRQSEGEALARDLSIRLQALEGQAHSIAGLAPHTARAHRDRLAARVAELSRGVEADPSRLAQEVAFFADRTDVAEELTRLSSHLGQMRTLLAAGGPAGRKLEFLVQEVNREVNTVGSKAQSAPIATLVVEMKAELERIREQVQNVE